MTILPVAMAVRALTLSATTLLHVVCLCTLMLVGVEAEVAESEYEAEQSVEVTATTGITSDVAAGSPPAQQQITLGPSSIPRAAPARQRASRQSRCASSDDVCTPFSILKPYTEQLI